MADRSIDVEKMVREVLSDLGLAGPAGPDVAGQPQADAQSSPPTSSPTRHETTAPAASPSTSGELVVRSSVVTMAELGDELTRVRRLVVPPQALVTPAVRDELARRNVTLVYDRPARAASGAKVRLVLTVLGSRFDPVPLGNALENEPIEIETRRADCLVAATDELARELAGPVSLGLLVSTYPAVAVCLANRHRGVRAVWGVDAGRLAADAASVGANLLVLDPSSTSFFQLKQMAIRFVRAGPAACPQELRQRLE